MFCAAYERKLKDAAAAAELLSGELRQHLRICDACASEWQREQALFAALDVRLGQMVNVDMPGSLLPGVRQGVLELEPQTNWWKPALGLAAAAVIAVVAVRSTLLRSGPEVLPEPNRGVALSAPAVAGDTGIGSGPVQKIPARPAVRLQAKDKVVNDQPSQDVLTSPAEIAGLHQYLQRLRTRTGEPAVLEEAKNGEPFAIRDVEFGEIDLGVVTIAPLDGGK